MDSIVVRHMSESALLASDMRVSAGALRPLAQYHNNRDGGFTNVSSLLGDVTPAGDNGESYGNVWGAGFQPGWADYDNDGDPDLYVVNDFGGILSRTSSGAMMAQVWMASGFLLVFPSFPGPMPLYSAWAWRWETQR